jgi:hypothetical protein
MLIHPEIDDPRSGRKKQGRRIGMIALGWEAHRVSCSRRSRRIADNFWFCMRVSLLFPFIRLSRNRPANYVDMQVFAY